MLLSGEPGIGKSRLVEVVRSRLHEPHTVLRYQCSSLHLNDPLHPVIRQLEDAARLGRNDPPTRRSAKLHALLDGATNHLAKGVPLIADLLVSPPTGRDDREKNPDTKRLLPVLVTLLVDLAARRPLLLVVEDVQWIDPTSLDLLKLAVERARDLPILCLSPADHSSDRSGSDPDTIRF